MNDWSARPGRDRTWIGIVIGSLLGLIFVGSFWPLTILIFMVTIAWTICQERRDGNGRVQREAVQLAHRIALLERDLGLDGDALGGDEEAAVALRADGQ